MARCLDASADDEDAGTVAEALQEAPEPATRCHAIRRPGNHSRGQHLRRLVRCPLSSGHWAALLECRLEVNVGEIKEDRQLSAVLSQRGLMAEARNECRHAQCHSEEGLFQSIPPNATALAASSLAALLHHHRKDDGESDRGQCPSQGVQHPRSHDAPPSVLRPVTGERWCAAASLS